MYFLLFKMLATTWFLVVIAAALPNVAKVRGCSWLGIPLGSAIGFAALAIVEIWI